MRKRIENMTNTQLFLEVRNMRFFTSTNRDTITAEQIDLIKSMLAEECFNRIASAEFLPID